MQIYTDDEMIERHQFKIKMMLRKYYSNHTSLTFIVDQKLVIISDINNFIYNVNILT
jgi:hypothetical protein